MRRNYYLILGVTSDASREEIHNAYRRLVKTIHPDVSGADSSERFREVQEAWETLSHEDRRRNYDSTLRRAQRSPSRPASSSRPSSYPFKGHPSGFEEDPSEEFGAAYPSAAGMDEIHLGLQMTAAEAATGGQAPLRVPVCVRCPECAGRGSYFLFLCPACRGTGCQTYLMTFTLEVPAGLEHHSTLQVPLDRIGFPRAQLILHVEIIPSR